MQRGDPDRDDVDLNRLPIVKHSRKDGNITIGAGMNYTRDLETEIGNLAMLRMEVQDRNHTGMLFVPRHTYRHFEQYEAAGEGHAHGGPHRPSSAAGRGHELDRPLRRGRVRAGGGRCWNPPSPWSGARRWTSWPRPRAEIVIEGKLLSGVRKAEGPFGEFQCSYASGPGTTRSSRFRPSPCVAIPSTATASPTNFVEHQSLNGLPMEAHLYERLREVEGFSDVHDVHCAPYGGQFVILIRMTPHYEGQVVNVLMGALSSAYLHPKVAIAVDEDVDIHKPEEILWAIGTRFNPDTDVHPIRGTRNHPMDVALPQVAPPGARWQRVGGQDRHRRLPPVDLSAGRARAA